MKYLDMHVHLDFMNDPLRIARDAEAAGVGMLAVTVTPADYLRLREEVKGAGNVRPAVGLHPWWAADGRCTLKDAAMAAELARGSRFVGEIGLDASPKHVPEGSLPAQIQALEMICSACAGSNDPAEPKILSLHSVKAAGLTLDILERTGCLGRCRCIFHWFTGSNEELTRALKAGCMFSVNEMMLRTRRGREYVRQLPADRLLTETDLPPGEHIPFPAAEITASLERTIRELNALRGTDMTGILAQNAERLLGSRL